MNSRLEFNWFFRKIYSTLTSRGDLKKERAAGRIAV